MILPGRPPPAGPSQRRPQAHQPAHKFERATAGERGLAAADVTLSPDKTLTPRNDLLGDRRPELYSTEP